MRTWLVLVAALCVTLTAASKLKDEPTPKPPVPAFCKAIWLFPNACAEINSTLIQQIKLFSPNAGCDVCNYLIVSATNATLTVDHSSLDGFAAETIIFKFSTNPTTGGCRLFVQSQNLGPPNDDDKAVNYCNIYDLLTGSGLDLTPGFVDKTNKWACPGMALAPCKA